MPNPITSIILTAVDKTKAAFASAKAGIDSLGAASTGVSGLLRNLFAGVSVVYFVGKLRNVVEGMNEVSESAQRAGTSVENLTALQYAGQQAGVDDMQKSLVALVAALESARDGSGKAFEAFAALEIDPTQFEDPADALVALADKFAALPDGVQKTSLAIDIFGKRVGPGMIPLLNEGSTGLARMRKEAEALGKVMDQDAADAADRFGDNLDRMKGHIAGAAQGLIGQMLPSLNQYLEAMDDVIRNGSALDKVRFFGFGNISPEVLDRITTSTEKLAQARADLKRATEAAAEVDLGETGYIKRQRQKVAALEAEVAAEERAAKAKQDSAKAAAQAARDNEKAVELREESAKALKESVEEQIDDAERLGDALRTAFSDSIEAEEDYLRRAKKLRAEASGTKAGDDTESQAAAALDATIAAMRLQREAGTSNLETVQAQAEALRQMAGQLKDVEQAESLRRQANLAEAAALEKAASDERARYQGIAEQQRLAADEAERLRASLEGIGKTPVSVKVNADPGIAKLLGDLNEIEAAIGRVNNLKITPGAGGTANAMADALRTAALQHGRRR